MVYISTQLFELFMPASCTVKIKPISTSMVTQLVHNEPVISLVCDEDLADSIARVLVVEDFPCMGNAFCGKNPGLVVGDTLIVLLNFDMNDVATWAEYTFSE